MKRYRVLGAGLVLMVAGCIRVGPDFAEPTASVTSQWIEAEQAGVATDRAADRAWWTVFEDERLNRLVELAYSQNLTLLTTGLRVLEARAQLGIAIGDQYPQTQQAFGSLTYNRQSARAPFSSGPASQLDFWQNQFGLQASWEIDFWGKFRRAIEAADASLLASIADYDNALVTLVSDVAGSYVQYRTLQVRKRIAEENVKAQRESLEIAEVRFTGGTTSERDVEQARTVLASTQATIPQLDSALQRTRNAISVLLGLPPGQLADLLDGPDVIPVAPPRLFVGIPAELLRRRPDIRAAELRAAVQSAQIGIARADLYPAFSLTGNFGFLASDWSNFNLSDIFLAKSRTYSVGPTFQWNILNYGQITNNVRVQDAQFQAAVTDYQNTVLRAQQEVEDGIIAFLYAQQRTDLLGLSADAARRSRDLAVLQYREGITDFTTVLTAEQNLLQQQDSLAVSQGEIPNSVIQTYTALGGGWQVREDDEFVPPAIREVMAHRTNWGNLLKPAAIQVDANAPILAPDW